MSSLLVVSGPNLDQLGSREPEVYGTATLADHLARVREIAGELSIEVADTQSNFEGDLVEAIHAARGVHDAIVINPGALTHYSWSLRDALECFEGIKIEVHLSNPAAREAFRRATTIAGVVDGTIAGLGQLGYELAVRAISDLLGARD
jgi:3-dehydroquinate dehydratase-2